MIPVMIPVMYSSYDPAHSRNLIIMLISQKGQLVWGMGGSDGCRNDILLIVMDYKNTGGKC